MQDERDETASTHVRSLDAVIAAGTSVPIDNEFREELPFQFAISIDLVAEHDRKCA